MQGISHEEMGERAALYALGTLDGQEARAFEEHLSEGCDECAAELRGFQEVTGALALLASAEDKPPARVREKLSALVRNEPRTQPVDLQAAQAPLITLRADEGEWVEIAKGVMVKQLFVDRESRMVTSLFKFAPGASIPVHRHLGIEQCYVVEGDFHADNKSLGAGDFQCAPAGSIHEHVYTEHGALVLIVAPERCELL